MGFFILWDVYVYILSSSFLSFSHQLLIKAVRIKFLAHFVFSNPPSFFSPQHNAKKKKCFVCNAPTNGVFNTAHEIIKKIKERKAIEEAEKLKRKDEGEDEDGIEDNEDKGEGGTGGEEEPDEEGSEEDNA